MKQPKVRVTWELRYPHGHPLARTFHILPDEAAAKTALSKVRGEADSNPLLEPHKWYVVKVTRTAIVEELDW